jgi:hypothetical protein
MVKKMNNYIVSCRNDKCDLYEYGTKFNCFWADVMYEETDEETDDLDMASDFIRDCDKSKQFVCDVVEYEEK